MANNKLSVFHYDDKDTTLIPNVLSYQAKDLGLEIIPTVSKVVSESIELLEKFEFDLIILDMIDQTNENKITGTQILEFLLTAKKTTSVFIYSSADREKTGISASDLKSKYSFIEGFFQKEFNFTDIKKAFRKFLEVKGLIPSNFELIDKTDYNLISEINSVGQNEINTLLVRIKNHKPKDDSKYILSKITSGLSGASIFRAEYELSGSKKSFLLKISHDKNVIRKEYFNAEFYKLLPRNFRLEYDKTIPKEELETEKSSAIVIEYAEKISTLYEWLLSDEVRDNPTTINNLFAELFLENGLSAFYSSNKFTAKEKYNYIFKKLDEKRISFIKRSIIELSPIFRKYSTGFDNDLTTQILFNNTYQEINYQTSDKRILQKELVLMHGDFHSKNILISSTNRPTIIDTGGFGFDYWCSDISRLIVNLFIEGIDINTYDFFSTESQIKRLEMAKQIISGEELSIEAAPSTNNGFITAINWLRKNVRTIHTDYFSEWEFQLNLGLEFYKASYKTIVLPPGKRVLALMSACEAINQANSKLKLTKV